MKHEVLKVVSAREAVVSLTWIAVFVAAMSAMMAYVIRPVLDEWLSHTTGVLLDSGHLSLVAVAAGLILLLVCFVLSAKWRRWSAVCSSAARPSLREPDRHPDDKARHG